MTADRRNMVFGVTALGIAAAAAFFRLHDLGMSAFRADTILLWSLAQRHIPPVQLWTQWFEVSGAAGQMPMPAWIMQLFLSLTEWPVTPFWVRFPHALLGMLAVPVAYAGACRMGGKGMGLVLAALVAVNPYHIGYSREAYFYASAFLGYFLFFWAMVALTHEIRGGHGVRWKTLLLLAAALFFTAYSQITGLILCAAGALILGAVLFLNREGCDQPWRSLGCIAGVYSIVLAPLVFAAWGLKPLLSQIGANREAGAQVVALSGERLLPSVGTALLRFAWGNDAWAVGLLVLSLALAVAVMIRRKEKHLVWIPGLMVLQLVLFALSRKASGATYDPRYMSGIMPFYLALIAYGLWNLPSLLPRKASPFAWIACAAAVAAGVPAAYLQTRVTGKPTPYFEIVRWTDSNLPAGTPVLVDRWFEPWNELKAHPSTNVQFTFTIPNEPLDNFLKGNWRKTAEEFLVRNPDAAYLEIAKTYWDAPGVGPWEWPRKYFARHVTIANEAGLKLRKLGLATRSDFYSSNSNRVVVEIFYNTEEDVIAKARADGRSVLALYGPGWQYTKTGDYRDWRTIPEKAEMRLWNLTDGPLTASPVLRAAAMGGPVRLRAKAPALQVRDFPPNQLTEWTLEPMTLQPGMTTVILTPEAQPNRGLLVEHIRASVIQSGEPE